MTKESSYELLQKKQWRAITYDWDILSSYGNNARLYCLTDFQAAWLLSNTNYMRFPTRWSDCPCTPGDLDHMAAELEYNLMNCIDFDPYQMQYLYDRAVTSNLNDLEIRYIADGIPGINPNTPTDFYTGDGSFNRVNALCMACEAYVKSYLQNWLVTARTLLGLTFLLGLAVVVNPLTGIIAAIVVGGFAFVTQAAINAVSDESAVEDVICCMLTALTGATMNQTNFEESLDACGFTPGSNAAIVRDLVASDLNQDKNWYSFLEQLGKGYVLNLAGADYECPCDIDIPWCVLYDFDNPDGTIEHLCGNPDGTALDSNDVLCAGAYYARLTAEFDEFYATEIEVSITTTGNNPGLRTVFQLDYDGSNVHLQQNNPAPAGTYVYTYTPGIPTLIDRFLIYGRNGTTTVPPTSDTARINYIRIAGINFNPFLNGDVCP